MPNVWEIRLYIRFEFPEGISWAIISREQRVGRGRVITYFISPSMICKKLPASLVKCRQVATEGRNATRIDFVSESDMLQPEIGEVVVRVVQYHVFVPALQR